MLCETGSLLEFRDVWVPQLFPYLMAATRGGLALIWKIVLVVELLGRSSRWRQPARLQWDGAIEEPGQIERLLGKLRESERAG